MQKVPIVQLHKLLHLLCLCDLGVDRCSLAECKIYGWLQFTAVAAWCHSCIKMWYKTPGLSPELALSYFVMVFKYNSNIFFHFFLFALTTSLLLLFISLFLVICVNKVLYNRFDINFPQFSSLWLDLLDEFYFLGFQLFLPPGRATCWIPLPLIHWNK